MRFICVRDDLVSKVMEISENQGRSISDYVNEVFEQSNRAYELNCSLKEIVDIYERTITQKGVTEEAQPAESLSGFERLLESKLIPESRAKSVRESEERKMLSRFLSQISKEP